MLRALLLLVSFSWLGACGKEALPVPFRVVSWSGSDGRPVALDQVLTVEFNQSLSAPIRASAVQLLDEGEHPVAGVQISMLGRWLHLEPQLPRQADLEDGSLKPNSSYSIRLHGLPWLRALTSTQGGILGEDLVLRFHTLDALSPSALGGLGVESSSLHLRGSGGREPRIFAYDEDILLAFTRGLDPRSLAQPALWRAQAQEKPVEVSLRLVANTYNQATVKVLLGDWKEWGVLELPTGIEGLGGWPLPDGDRRLRLVRRRPDTQ